MTYIIKLDWPLCFCLVAKINTVCALCALHIDTFHRRHLMIKMNSVENKSDLLSSEFADSELSSGDFQSPSPSYDSAIETQDMSLFSQDQFEGIFYRTQISESKITISFVSKVFFDIFKNKIHSDFIQSVDIDETSFISKCSTHVKGAKCELRLDSHFRTE